MLESDVLGRRGIAETRIGFLGNTDTATRSARARGTAEERATYDWWVDSGVALVGSPETIRRRLEEHRKTLGYDILCTNHRIGTMDPDLVLKSIKLFGEEVIPAFS